MLKEVVELSGEIGLGKVSTLASVPSFGNQGPSGDALKKMPTLVTKMGPDNSL